MSLIHKYYCEICGAERRDVKNWYMAEVTSAGVLLSHWREDRAKAPNTHHFCGEAHSQVFVSRYFASPEAYLSKRRELITSEKDLTAVQSHLVRKVLQQPSELGEESEEIFDLLAAAEAALKGKVTVDPLNNEYFDA
jgi:hypothetical protein